MKNPIREEIEELRQDAKVLFEWYKKETEIGNPFEGKVKFRAGELSILNEVLAILDRYECIADGEIGFEECTPEGEKGVFVIPLVDDAVLGIILKYRGVNPGDHIIIFVEGKE